MNPDRHSSWPDKEFNLDRQAWDRRMEEYTPPPPLPSRTPLSFDLPPHRAISVDSSADFGAVPPPPLPLHPAPQPAQLAKATSSRSRKGPPC